MRTSRRSIRRNKHICLLSVQLERAQQDFYVQIDPPGGRFRAKGDIFTSEYQNRLDGEMVGDESTLVIGLGDGLETGAGKSFEPDIVDGVVSLAPAVVGKMVVRDDGRAAGILEALFHRGQESVGHFHIEVSRDDDREGVAVEFANLVGQELDSLFLRLSAYVVDMSVDEEELPAGGLVLQDSPGGAAVAGAVPSAAGLVRGV